MPDQRNGGARYHVTLLEPFTQAIKRSQRKAGLQGRGEEFLSALRQIVEQIQYDPHRLGEPLYHLPALRLQVRSVALGPLHVTFGVHEDRPIVFLQGARLLAAR
jgi:hypothetical protein